MDVPNRNLYLFRHVVRIHVHYESMIFAAVSSTPSPSHHVPAKWEKRVYVKPDHVHLSQSQLSVSRADETEKVCGDLEKL